MFLFYVLWKAFYIFLESVLVYIETSRESLKYIPAVALSSAKPILSAKTTW